MKKQPFLLLGGTFDPIHNGHIQMADAVYKHFNSPVTFMPTATPNYKAAPSITNNQRLDLLKLALANYPDFIINDWEITQNNYSPTYNTLSYLREILGPQVPIFYIIGLDSLITLDKWDSWQQLFNLTNFIVLKRPHYDFAMLNPLLQNFIEERGVTDLNAIKGAYGKILTLDFVECDISSTQIRQNIKAGLNISDMVPDLVNKYIIKNNLYKE